MESVQYLRALARSWWIVLVTLIAGGVGGYVVYHRATPIYQASVRMIVTGTNSDKGVPVDEVTARVIAIQRAAALAQVAGTAPAVRAAARAAGYPGGAPSVSAGSDENGPFITVTVTDTVAARAKAIADSFAQVLPSVMTSLEGRTTTTVSASNLAPAALPSEPISPSLTKDLGLGLAGGLVLGLAIAFLREALDRTVRETSDLERVAELTVLGIVPRDLPKSPLPVATNPRSVRAEAYRQIRTTLLNTEEPVTTLAVTSASVSEGKTSVATNLALSFSRAGHRVAIVDADLRRPKVATVLGLPGRPGLSDVLARRLGLMEAITYADDGRLAVLPAGPIPANPSEALGGGTMEEVIDQLADAFEYVIVDTPPVLPVTDALVVAPMVDGVLLVTRLGRTTREQVRRAIAAVHRVNADFIGIVPNQAGTGRDREYRYGYKYAPTHKSGERPTEISASLLKPATHQRATPTPDPAPAGGRYDSPAVPPFPGYVPVSAQQPFTGYRPPLASSPPQPPVWPPPPDGETSS